MTDPRPDRTHTHPDDGAGGQAPLLDASQVRDLLTELADVLDAHDPDGPTIELTIAGGAYLATLGLRAATRDVDSITPLPEEVRAAAAQLAARHGLAPDWLNDGARPFRPAGLEEAGGAGQPVLCARGRLRVVGAGPDAVLLMKLSAARGVDVQDILALWPLTSYADAAQVVAAYEAAYPHEEHDAHLRTWIQTLIDAAEGPPHPRADA